MSGSDDSADTEHTTQAAPDSGPPVAGRLIGRYRIIRELGRGGMGEVYLAARADDEYRKHVALKLIRAGGETQEALLRHFRRERQILAALDHPNIAKLLDGGTTESGLPYFVMDYIEGVPIDEYCDRRRLTVAQRLTLFESVCAAAAYAHRNLVIHRDIKPTNILVTKEGVPKLLDFGLAKLLNPDLGIDTATGTRFAFTAAYASPEQVQGEAVNTATDVYSLGVVLYELLTGHSPYRVKTRGSVDVLNAVVRQEPERPSTVVRRTEEVGSKSGKPIVLTPELVSRTREGSTDRLRRCLRGDLDNILLKALRKEPDRRYRSVDAFSEDLVRYAERRPVAARRGTLGYRAGKFVRRHKVGVLAATLALAGIVGGSLLATYGFVRARAAEREAVNEAAKATAINDFLQGILMTAHPSKGRGREMTVVDALATGVRSIASSFGEQPEIRAAVQNTIGRTYIDLALYDEAEPLLREALATRRTALGAEHPDVAESLHDLAALAVMKGDFETGEALFRESIAMLERTLGHDALPVGEALNDLALTLQWGKEDLDQAQLLLERGLEVRRAHLGDRHRDVAQSVNNLGMLHYRRGDLEQAEPLLREALALNRELLGDEHVEVASGQNNLALLFRRKEEYPEAIEHFQEALDVFRAILGEPHPEIAQTTVNLAATLVSAGRYDEAETQYRAALAMQREIYPEGHFHIATAQNLLGGCLTEAGRYADAEPLLTGSYAFIRESFGDDHPRTRAARNRVVRLYEAWGKPEEAAPYKSAASE